MKQKKAGVRNVLNRLCAKMKTNKKLEAAVYIGVGLLVVVLYVSSINGGKDEAAEGQQTASALPEQSIEQSETAIETRLEEALSSIRGAGKVKVMITYETGAELIPAMSSDTSSNHSENVDDTRQSSSAVENETVRPATISNGSNNTPIILKQRQPIIRGAIIMAEGAADIGVKLSLQRAATTVLAVPVNNVEVFELAKTEK